MQDPSIKQMAEQIANDPSFMGLTQQLQESMATMMGGAEGAGAAAGGAAAGGGIPGMPPGMPGMPPGMAGMPGMPPMPGMPGMDPANFDPTKYMQAMSGMFQNPQFMQMAEKLGQAIIQVRSVFVQRHGQHLDYNWVQFDGRTADQQQYTDGIGARRKCVPRDLHRILLDPVPIVLDFPLLADLVMQHCSHEAVPCLIAPSEVHCISVCAPFVAISLFHPTAGCCGVSAEPS
jgi:hypothetical protein